ncbi:hypothetical protein ACQPXS_45610 [Streptomyces sp. CA-142005]|uniref:hypothetical protein n=1 Tax=Streptomyces sp. CA-142005 TaxID=3240052 RepID=UPI003D8DDF3D
MSFARCRRTRHLAVTVLVALAAAACSVGHDDPRPPRPDSSAAPTGQPDKLHPVVAFVQPAHGSVLVADASGRTWKAADMRPSASVYDTAAQWPTKLAWSPGGRRLAWLDAPNDVDQTGQIHIVDVRTGKETARPCPCQGIGFLGDDAVSLSSDGSSLLLFPAAGGARRVALTARQRPYSRLVAGGTDDVVLFSPLLDGPGVERGQGTLAVADRKGTVRLLLPAKGRTTFGDAQRQPHGTGLVWSSADSGGACWTLSSVYTHPVTTSGDPRSSLPHDAALRHALVTQARLVTSLAWVGDGITTTFSAVPTCQVMFPARTVSYYLRDGHWTYLGSGMLGIALGADGRVVRLEDPVYPRTHEVDEQAITTGTLTLTAHGRKRVLATGVSQFVLTPAESAAARPPTTPAREPGEGVTAEDDHGARLPAAVRKLAGEIEDAAARGHTRRLAALCDPCSATVRRWVSSGDGARDVLRAIRTHPRRLSGGLLIYPEGSTCVDEPHKDISCTPQQLRDAAVLALKPGVSPGLGYGGSAFTTADAVRVPLTLSFEGGTAQWTGLGVS